MSQSRREYRSSSSRIGSCLDNAVAKRFFATFKTEFVYRITPATKRHVRRVFNVWFDRYNRHRRHSYCGYQPPPIYEETNTDNTRAA